MNLLNRDKKIIWHPFTQEKIAEDVIPIKTAKGSYLYDEQGKGYLDLISSWWVNLHGHAHPEITQSIYEQAQQLEHVMFAGFTHNPAVELCERLQTLLPQDLKRFFFSDNGSTSVEIALKMSYQYWSNIGKTQKKIFIAFEGGYHGDTFGAMSVGAKSGFHDKFSDLFFKVLHLPYPDTWQDDIDICEREKLSLQKLDQYLNDYGNQIAAIIFEPLVQGAAGMRMCRPQFLQEITKKVREKDILVIFDEVMTGFGRTGRLFAMDHLGIAPDFLCLSKGLTGGFLPLALTVTSQKIYDAFLGDSFDKALAHGHTYTGNPIACQAGIASLRLLLSTDCKNARENINKAHQEGVKFLKSCHKIVQKIRMCGTIAAFDVDCEKRFMDTMKSKFLKAGILLRPINNSVYLIPPYCTTVSEIEEAYEIISKILQEYQ